MGEKKGKKKKMRRRRRMKICLHYLHHRLYFVENDLEVNQPDANASTMVLISRYIIVLYHSCTAKTTWLIVYRVLEDLNMNFELVQAWDFSDKEESLYPLPLLEVTSNNFKNRNLTAIVENESIK